MFRKTNREITEIMFGKDGSEEKTYNKLKEIIVDLSNHEDVENFINSHPELFSGDIITLKNMDLSRHNAEGKSEEEVFQEILTVFGIERIAVETHFRQNTLTLKIA